MLYSYFYKVCVIARNSLIFPRYKELVDSDKAELAALQEIQNSKLNSLVRHAYENSAYYQNIFDEANVDPSSVVSIHDLSHLKITTKADLLNENSAIQNFVSGEKHFYSETSGSSGNPLVFYRNQDWDAWTNACYMRGCKWHGVDIWDRNGYLWGYNFKRTAALKTKFLDFLQNRFRLFSYNNAEMSKFCKKLETAQYLGGYSSMIHQLAKYVLENPQSAYKYKLKFIRGTSEKIFEYYQETVLKAFGRRIISEYGAAEAGIIAFECEHGAMHINMETVIVEVVDNEIVLTNLASKSFPIIRYALGDYIEIVPDRRCVCGRSSEIIETVTGRVGSTIIGEQGRYPSLVLYYVFKNLAMSYGLELNYQGVQESRGKLTLKVEKKLSVVDLNHLNAEIKKYFNDDLIVTIKDSESWVTGGTKTKDFVSHIE